MSWTYRFSFFFLVFTFPLDAAQACAAFVHRVWLLHRRRESSGVLPKWITDAGLDKPHAELKGKVRQSHPRALFLALLLDFARWHRRRLLLSANARTHTPALPERRSL
jgi:hypothetical protein